MLCYRVYIPHRTSEKQRTSLDGAVLGRMREESVTLWVVPAGACVPRQRAIGEVSLCCSREPPYTRVPVLLEVGSSYV